jgi:hypothetical protein
MKITDYPDETRKAFAVWQMFRDLGFKSADLYVGIVNGCLLIQVQGPSGFSVSLGRTPMPPARFAQLWTALAESVPTWSEETLRENYFNFVTPERILAIYAALDANGIPIPADPRKQHRN